MGYVVPKPPMRLKGMCCPCCGSEDVRRVADFGSLFLLADRRECGVCGFRTGKVEKWYLGPWGCMWVTGEEA